MAKLSKVEEFCYICKLSLFDSWIYLKIYIMEEMTTALNEEMSAPEVQSVNEMIEVEEGNVAAPDYSSMGLKEIIQAFEEMLARGDQQELYKYSDVIKASFYKVLKREKIAAGAFEDGAATAEGEQKENPFLEIEKGFKELFAKYRSERTLYVQDMEREKNENLAKKMAIIEELKGLLEKAEDVNQTFPAFRDLQARWKEIGQIPQANVKEVWDTYQHLVEKFYDYIKINNEFRDLDFKKNMEAKTALCERAEALEKEPNVVNAFKELQNLHNEWKEIGPVAKEFRESIWERFKAITASINKKHQQFFENLKDEQKKNLELKEAICVRAEEIANKVVEDSNEWNMLSKKMEALQEEWKGIGFASKKDNQKIYARLREACDKFYNAKRDYYANFKNVMQENLAKKEALCQQAEELMTSQDWKRVTDQLIALQKQWKEIGPVARKQSDAVWKRFRAACDTFFNNKAKHFSSDEEEYAKNLAEKRAVIEEIRAYAITGDKEADVAAMRGFIDKFNEIGFVPFKEKAAVQQAFNAVMDEKFGQIRNIANEKELSKFKKRVADIKSNAKGGERSLKFERDKLLQRFRKMEQDIAVLENNMGFFAKSKNAEIFKADIQKKIADAREEMARLEEKIRMIDKEF